MSLLMNSEWVIQLDKQNRAKWQRIFKGEWTMNTEFMEDVMETELAELMEDCEASWWN